MKSWADPAVQWLERGYQWLYANRDHASWASFYRQWQERRAAYERSESGAAWYWPDPSWGEEWKRVHDTSDRA